MPISKLNFLKQFSVSLLTILCATACTKQQEHPVEPVQKAAPVQQVPEVPSVPKEPPSEVEQPGPVCPNKNNVTESISDCKDLLADANKISADVRKNNADLFKTEIAAWRNDYKEWKEKNDNLIQGCELLVGADGTSVHPRLPKALKLLAAAGTNLEQSIDASAAGDGRRCSAYIRTAKRDLHRASGLI